MSVQTLYTAATGMQALDSIQRIERSGRPWDFPMPMVIRTALFLGAALLLLQGLAQLLALVGDRPERA